MGNRLRVRTVAVIVALAAQIITGIAAGMMAAMAAEPPPREFTILAVGDTGFNASLAPVHPDTGTKLGDRIGFAQSTQGIRAQINGDLNFANLETIVTDRNDLTPVPKTYNFRTHPNAVRHLLDLGFNLLSTANNHSMDYGTPGAAETLKHLNAMDRDRLLAAPGLGVGRAQAASAQRVVWERDKFRRFDPDRHLVPPLVPAGMGLDPGWRWDRFAPPVMVAISAIGIGGQGWDPGEGRAGQLSYLDGQDFAETLDRLSATPAEFRILSVHQGREMAVMTDENAIQRFRRQAVRANNIDLILGHHQHVVAGVELVGGKVIFYGLGNFIHFGTRDLSGNGMCRDYGLMARVHMSVTADARVTIQAIEAIPLGGTHRAVRPLQSADARLRIAVLNTLAAQFDRPAEDARGVRFQARSDGTGLYCQRGAQALGGRIGALCKDYTGPTYFEDGLQARIRTACAGQAMVQAEE